MTNLSIIRTNQSTNQIAYDTSRVLWCGWQNPQRGCFVQRWSGSVHQCSCQRNNETIYLHSTTSQSVTLSSVDVPATEKDHHLNLKYYCYRITSVSQFSKLVVWLKVWLGDRIVAGSISEIELSYTFELIKVSKNRSISVNNHKFCILCKLSSSILIFWSASWSAAWKYSISWYSLIANKFREYIQWVEFPTSGSKCWRVSGYQHWQWCCERTR